MADRKRKLGLSIKTGHRGSMRSAKEKRSLKIPVPVVIACCVGAVVLAALVWGGVKLGIRLYDRIHQPVPILDPGTGATEEDGRDLSYPGITARDTGSETPSLTANPDLSRDLSYLAEDTTFTEAQINTPGIYGNELFFSAGTGSLDSNVLTKLYLYNLESKTEEKVSTTAIYMGEYYETLINDRWLVYLETDHGKKNNIYVRDRMSGTVTLLKTCTNGKPKLRLYENTLIWMEQEEEIVDNLYMVDLVTQENLTLFTFEDVATYGVSAPAVYGDWIVWAAPDPNQTEEERAREEHSAIYYLNISCDFDESGNIKPRMYCPGTYVHEPYFNGQYFLWIDTNKSFHSNLYLAEPGDETPLIVDTQVTAYGLGDDIAVYGRDSIVWLYVISTGEHCRLTSLEERGILPNVNGRTVVWQNTAADGSKDTLRYKILTDEDLYPNGKPARPAAPNPNLFVPDPTPVPEDEEEEEELPPEETGEMTPETPEEENVPEEPENPPEDAEATQEPAGTAEPSGGGDA